MHQYQRIDVMDFGIRQVYTSEILRRKEKNEEKIVNIRIWGVVFVRIQIEWNGRV